MEKTINSYNKDFCIDDIFKSKFDKSYNYLCAVVNVKETDKFISQYKKYLIKHKMFSPIKRIKEENVIILNFHSNEENLKELSNILKDSPVKINRIESIEVKLGYDNISYEDIIKEILPDNNFKDFPRSFEIIGSIAHVNIREEFLEYKYLIGALILNVSNIYNINQFRKTPQLKQ